MQFHLAEGIKRDINCHSHPPAAKMEKTLAKFVPSCLPGYKDINSQENKTARCLLLIEGINKVAECLHLGASGLRRLCNGMGIAAVCCGVG
jgi:hypothetical protein